MPRDDDEAGASDELAPVVACEVCNNPFMRKHLSLKRDDGELEGCVCEDCTGKLLSLLPYLGNFIIVVDPQMARTHADGVIASIRKALELRILSDGQEYGRVNILFVEEGSTPGEIIVRGKRGPDYRWSDVSSTLMVDNR